VAFQSTIFVLDAHVSFVEPAEFDGAEVDVRDTIGVADGHSPAGPREAPASRRM
jgi:hypothetical protein